MSETKVQADLVVNDLTAATFSKIKSGFHAIEHQVDHVTSGMMGFVKSTASTALGFQLASLPHMLHAVADNAIEAAMAASKEEKSIAAALMMTDRKGRSYGELREEAGGLRKELREMGMNAGVSGDSVVESFNDIAARTNKSTEEVKRMMGQMVQAGRIAPGGLASITSGFEMLEMGVARARNPIVQMISSTGLLHGNARQVAKEMQKMAPDKMMELAEKAITRMAKKMENVPLSFGEAVTSMKDMREEIFDIVGMPIFKGFAPIMRTIREEFKAHKEDIAAWGETVGKQAAEGVKWAGDELKQAMTMLRDNWGEISADIKGAAGALTTAAKFVVDHKDVFGRMAAGGLAPEVNIATGNAGHSSVGGILGDVGGGAAMGGKLGGPLGAAVGGAIGALGALTEETVALGYDLGQLWSKTGESKKAIDAEIEALDKSIKKRQAEMEAIDAQVQKRDAYTGAQRQLTKELGMTGEQGTMPTAQEMLPGAGFKDMMVGARDVMDEESTAMAQSMAFNFKQMYEYAEQSHDAGAMNAVENILMNSKQLQYALVMSSVDVGKGFDDLIDAMVEGGRMTAEAGKHAKELVASKGGEGLAKMGGVHVGGGNTVNMKLDFKQGDPDRIMVRFKSEFMKAATHKIAARAGGPLG